MIGASGFLHGVFGDAMAQTSLSLHAACRARVRIPPGRQCCKAHNRIQNRSYGPPVWAANSESV